MDISSANYVHFGSEIWEPGKEPKNPLPALASSLKYLVSAGKRKIPVSVTLWVLADVSSSHGRKLLQNAVEFLEESSTHSRIAFIPTDENSYPLKSKLVAVFSENNIKEVLNILRDFKDSDIVVENQPKTETELNNMFLKLIGFPKGSAGIVVNGRIIGPLSPSEIFDIGDWALIEKFSYDGCAKFIGNLVYSSKHLDNHVISFLWSVCYISRFGG